MGFIDTRDQGGLTAVRRAAFPLFYVTESGHCVPLSLANWLTRSLIGWNLLCGFLDVENLLALLIL